ncbi:MAG: ribonuclease E/G [Lachnospiraceae bacterium]|nr:ribonuclease E/G [Lachnospiraceae bacterium]
MNRIVITQLNDIKFLLVYEENVLVECHPLNENELQIGNIYLGRVQKKVKNINACFVLLDGDDVGYLPLDNKPYIVTNRQLPNGLASIAESDIILVEVEQEPIKLKQAKITGNISLTGRYVVLDLNYGHIGVSKKIGSKERREELTSLINPTSENNFGCVFRTGCDKADNSDIIAEYEKLSGKLESIIQKATYEKKTGLIYKGKPEYINLIDNYGVDRVSEIKTDDEEIYTTLLDYCKENEIKAEVSLYNDEYPYYKLLGLEEDVKKALNKKCWLKSGGFLIIEPTEAMVVIDVNTGKAIEGKDREKHILKINIEAAKEIARQLRLRNLSGIIMVDFINMKNEDDKRMVVDCLKKEFTKDKVSTNFIDITHLDVFEITRKKQKRPLYEIVKL